MPEARNRFRKRILPAMIIFLACVLLDKLLYRYEIFVSTFICLLYIILIVWWHQTVMTKVVDQQTKSVITITTYGIISWMMLKSSIMNRVLVPEFTPRQIYIIATVLILILGVIVATMILRCTIVEVRRKVYQPLLAIIVGAALCYASANTTLFDIQEAYAFTFVTTIEQCLSIGLIQTNMFHEMFFYISPIPSIITNADGVVCFRNNAAIGIDFNNPPAGYEISEQPITGGYIKWAQDTSEYEAHSIELEHINEVLKEDSNLLQAENELINKNSRIMSRTALYEQINQFARPIMDKIEGEINLFELGNDNCHLAMASIYTAYIKRRSNLILLPAEDGRIHASELRNSIVESVSAINLLGIAASVKGTIGGQVDKDVIIDAYDAVERVIEISLNNTSSINIFVDDNNGIYTIRIAVRTDGVLGDIECDNQCCSCSCEYISSKDICLYTITFSHEGGES